MSMPEQKPHRSKQNYGTPLNFLDAVKVRLGLTSGFLFDFAADATNAKALRWWGEEVDSLSMPATEWAAKVDGGWGWLNPPFTNIGPWAKKCMEMKEADGHIAFLVPAAVGSNWFRDYVDDEALVLLLNGRICFDPERPTWGYPKDCILCLYGPYVAPGYEVWTWNQATKRRAVPPPVGVTQ